MSPLCLRSQSATLDFLVFPDSLDGMLHLPYEEVDFQRGLGFGCLEIRHYNIGQNFAKVVDLLSLTVLSVSLCSSTNSLFRARTLKNVSIIAKVTARARSPLNTVASI